jgi:hypothetical protein
MPPRPLNTVGSADAERIHCVIAIVADALKVVIIGKKYPPIVSDKNRHIAIICFADDREGHADEVLVPAKPGSVEILGCLDWIEFGSAIAATV